MLVSDKKAFFFKKYGIKDLLKPETMYILPMKDVKLVYGGFCHD